MFHQSGARKKKCLTDKVKIIPFPDQDLREKASKAKTTPVIKQNKPVIQERPKIKSLKEPTGKLKSSTLSIKKMLSPEQAPESTININDMPNEVYSIDDIKRFWRQIAFTYKKEGHESFFSALVKRDPIVKEEHQFVLEVDNKPQLDMCTPLLGNFVSELRKKVKNYSVNVVIEMSKNAGEEVKYISGKDKFTKMARKNPNLHSLKSTFNLDIEY